MEVYILNAKYKKKNNYRDQYSRDAVIYFTVRAYRTLFYRYEVK